MTRRQRGKLLVYCEDLTDYTEKISEIADAEMDKLDNVPDNLRESDKFQDMESDAETIYDACDSIREAIDSIMCLT